MSASQVPAFFSADWYRDHNDHRCPHDSWLESLEITEDSSGSRNEIRSTAISIRLLGAYHDGHIIFRYSGVQSYILNARAQNRGHGDWLSDEILPAAEGFLMHRIRLSGRGSDPDCIWVIEAKDISYEWLPEA